MTPRDPTVFEHTADRYARVRPGYADELIEWVITRAELEPDARLLELGCGPGLATAPFARRGFEILAVDASANMIRNARERVGHAPHVTFVCSLFEVWDPPPTHFDMVYAGMAWHWLPMEGRDERVARLLADGGVVAVLTNWPVSNWREGADVYEAHWPDYRPPVPRTIEDRIDEAHEDLEASGNFRLFDVRRLPWTERYDAAQYVEVLRTYSDHHRLPPDVQRRFYAGIRARIDELGGSIERAYESVAMLARRA